MKVADLVDQGLDVEQFFDGQVGGAVRIDRVGDAADRQVLDVRGLAAEYRYHLVDLALIIQGLQVVGGGQQVDLGREFHRRVAPVAAGKDAQLAAADEFFQTVLDRLDLLGAVALPVGQLLAQGGGGLRDRPWWRKRYPPSPGRRGDRNGPCGRGCRGRR